jgi:LacI family transcriptional regulator
METAKRIALMIAQGSVAQAQVRLGIYRYARPHRPWDFLTLDLGPSAYELAARWKPDGAIGRAGRADLFARARRLRAPFVNLYGGPRMKGLAQVGCDNREIGSLAAEHLAGLGFRSFGYFGLQGDPSSDDRGRAFAEALARRGFRALFLDYSARYPEVRIRAHLVMPVETRLHRWLAWLPKPVAVFVCDDRRALLVSEACRHLHLQVPDEVAILGVENDEVSCFEAHPPLSSIRLPLQGEGWRAAELLHHLLKGGRPPNRPIYLKPEGVVTRQSSNILAIEDPRLAAALRHIRERAGRGLGVDEVARACGMNRRLLERRFRGVLNCSPFQEIRRVQIEQAKALLRDTDRKIDAIADEIGFGGRARFSVEFTRKVGVSPGAYRLQYRRR